LRNEKPGLRQAVAALEHRDFRLFYVALLVAGIGSQIQAFANVLQVYDLTGSALQLGLVGLWRAIPIIAFSLMGGVIADRVDRLRFSMVAQGLNGLFSIFLAALTWTATIDVWHIYLFTFLGSSVMAVNAPARSAIIPNLVPRNHLLNAIALNSTVWQSSNILGPMIAGLAVAGFGYVPTYLLNGVAQIVTISMLAMITIGPIAARPTQSGLHALQEGLGFIRRKSIILVLLSCDVGETLFGRYQALLPIIAAALGAGHAGTGILSAAPGTGSLIGAAIMMSLGNFRYKGLVVVGGILAYCAALALLAIAPWIATGSIYLFDDALAEHAPTSLSPWFALALAATFLLGVFDSVQATPRNGVIQLLTPDALRGRVSSFQSMLTGGVPSFGQAMNGAIAAVTSAPIALLFGATACAAMQLGLLATRKELRAADLGTEAEEPEPVPAEATAR
jgi:MFS family permease